MPNDQTNVVCIAGMHRAGTSMVARLLNLCGVYLGPGEDLASPTPDNPEGYWENLRFVRLNDRILTYYKGGWDCPPVLCEGWETSVEMQDYCRQAMEILRQFDNYPVWGWKDPRNSLTLPFWKRLLPELKLVFCLRNPLDVARSLQDRGFTSQQFGLNLWESYSRRLYEQAEGNQLIVTHYDSYFGDRVSELRRVTEFLGLEVSEDRLQQVSPSTSLKLRHHWFSEAEVQASNLSHEGKHLYGALCRLAGPVYDKGRGEEKPGVALGNPSEGSDQESSSIRTIRLAEEIIQAREEEIASLKRILQAREEELSSIKPVLQARDTEMVSLKEVLKARDTEMVSLKEVLKAREEELFSIKPVLEARETELESVKYVLRAREEELSAVKTVLRVKEEEPASIWKTFKILINKVLKIR